jgi:monothiol glutaredoxin
MKEYISEVINHNDIVLFMKGTATAPMCGFSATVVNILKLCGVNFKDINVLENEQLRQGIKEYSDWPTIPQLYIKGEFIGGCDITRQLYESRELKTLLAEKGIVSL